MSKAVGILWVNCKPHPLSQDPCASPGQAYALVYQQYCSGQPVGGGITSGPITVPTVHHRNASGFLTLPSPLISLDLF